MKEENGILDPFTSCFSHILCRSFGGRPELVTVCMAEGCLRSYCQTTQPTDSISCALQSPCSVDIRSAFTKGKSRSQNAARKIKRRSQISVRSGELAMKILPAWVVVERIIFVRAMLRPGSNVRLANTYQISTPFPVRAWFHGPRGQFPANVI